jgi:pilus assembly protein Flp/PilA
MFAYTLTLLQQVKADRKGVTALEYGVIASVAVVALLTAFTTFYNAFNGVFATITAAL